MSAPCDLAKSVPGCCSGCSVMPLNERVPFPSWIKLGSQSLQVGSLVESTKAWPDSDEPSRHGLGSILLFLLLPFLGSLGACPTSAP